MLCFGLLSTFLLAKESISSDTSRVTQHENLAGSYIAHGLDLQIRAQIFPAEFPASVDTRERSKGKRITSASSNFYYTCECGSTAEKTMSEVILSLG